jgi:hypothetical protein
MHNCAYCNRDLPDGGTGADRRFDVGPKQIDDNHEKITRYLCRGCYNIYEAGMLKWCPHHDHCNYYEMPNRDWATAFTLAAACPEHSTATTVSRLPCRACGTSTGELYLTVRGRWYCLHCYDVSISCAANGCSNRFPIADTAAYTAHGNDVYSCKQCPPVKMPRWFQAGRYAQHITKWPHSVTCGCRVCEYLSATYPDHFPQQETILLGDRRRCRNCDNTSYEGMEVNDRNHWYCHWCVEVYASPCVECDEKYLTHDLFPLAEDGGLVCTPCLRESGRYYFCEVGCHSWFRVDDDCQCGGVYPWNYVPENGFHFFTASGERFDDHFHPYIGFELEVEAITGGATRKGGAKLVRSLIGDEWSYLVHDGSLLERGQRGFEIVTHPFSLNWFNENWHTIENLLTSLSAKGYRSWESGRCGMHVHISRGPMTDAHQMKFLRFIYGSTNLALCVGQRSYRSRGVREYAPFDRERRDMFMDKIRGHANPGTDGHRAAVNANKEHTLEGRWFRGTLSPEGFRKNIEFMHSVWYFTRKFGFNSANEINYIQWLRSTPESRIYSTLLDYIERNYITRR